MVESSTKCVFYHSINRINRLTIIDAGFISIALVFDAVSAYFVRNLELYDEPEEIERKKQLQFQANLREQELNPMMNKDVQ